MSVSDLCIAVSYLAIAAGLFVLARDRGAPWLWIGALALIRRAAPQPWIWRGFAAFILACGVGHLVDVVAVWSPVYPVVAGIRVVTALASVTTAIVFCCAVWRIRHPPTADTLTAYLGNQSHVSAADQYTAAVLDDVGSILRRVES